MSVLDKASLVLVPSGYKEDTVYSVKPINGDGDLTFTRASDATRVNSAGLVERVPWNLLQNSNSFDTTWTNTRTSEASGYTGYNGTNDAWALIGTAVDSTHLIVQNITLSEQVVTFSVYAKAGAKDWCILRLDDGTPAYCYFDLSAGTKGTISGSYIDSDITSVGGGWYRLSITRVATNGTNVAVIYPAEADNDNTYLGDGVTEDLYIQDAQLNEGTLKPYFPTTDRLNVPRLDYSGGSCPSLLLEPQRTNLVLDSEDITSANWSPFNVTRTANQITSPSGYIDADLINAGTSSGAHYVQNATTSFTSGTTYTFSGFAKKGNASLIQLIAGSLAFGTNIWATYNFDTLEVTTGSASTASMVDYGNGWYRLILTGTCISTQTVQSFFYVFTNNKNTRVPSFTGSNETAYVWGAQTEVGAYATSYIPTLGATVTRLTDTMIVDDIYTNGLITSSGGTWYIEIDNNFVYTRDSSQVGIFIANDTSGGTSTDGLALRNNGSNARLTVNKRIATVQTQLYVTTADHVKVAFKWNGTTLDVFENGVKVVNATAFTPTIMEYFGSFGGDVPKYINESLLYPTPLTDAECIELTTL